MNSFILTIAIAVTGALILSTFMSGIPSIIACFCWGIIANHIAEKLV